MKNTDQQEVIILARNSEKNRELLKEFEGRDGLIIYWGDLTN